MAAPSRTHRDLVAWQLGMDLAAGVYRIVKRLPVTERFGLHVQLTKSAGSVPANIAEGYGLVTKAQFLKHLNIANGSLKEVETHLELAVRAELFEQEAITPLLEIADRLGGVIRGLRRSLS